ncbi:MAG: TetR family transcriptional regulator [Gemmatimonadetes bacterium]|nr:TetR/AcrR family transcriptional regulator [Gemmatimonadota bacterium]NIR78585.1 TetR/AcrR family transcriptional regulator [Gemmatimonadota bacterium]NIT89139.1 TetR/AcrR family transcriptional regulator [Gemmatimonadota bacterium]NIU31043.1 TetR/AcrR family transcriptional regulator [Gemmatimonadota bacterium]NIU35787.1 TetR family transcriptional regulator [Gemmatimonadota bacterium]
MHPPRQERSRRTLERIARAARELIAEHGVQGTTVQRIVDRAESSVGSFYARFDSRDDLLRYLEERVWRTARERWDEAVAAETWKGLSLWKVLEGVVSLLVRLYREDARVGRALGRNAGAPSPREETFHEGVIETLGELVRARAGEISHPDPASAMEFGYRWVLGGIRELGHRRDDDTLAREIARGWRAYLGNPVDASGKDSPGDVDFFDPWS